MLWPAALTPAPSGVPGEVFGHVGLTPGTSFAVGAGVVGAMVGCFYLFRSGKTASSGEDAAVATARDHPAVVRYRMRVMSGFAFGMPAALWGVAREGWGRAAWSGVGAAAANPWVRPPAGAVAAALGLRLDAAAARAGAVGLGLTLVLFGAPAAWAARQAWRRACLGNGRPLVSFPAWLWARQAGMFAAGGTVDHAHAMRTYVVAPVTEEMIFRACLLPVLLAGGHSPLRAAAGATSIFAAAHVHHLATRLHHAGESVHDSLAAIVLMVGYTSVFSAYACALFLRTGSVMSPVLAHTVCNWIGLPAFGAMFSGPERHAWIALQLSGIAIFCAAFAPATDPRWHGSPFVGGFHGTPG